MNQIITIGREFGSGGREFGRRLAEELGYEYYDKEIIAEIAKKTELSESYVQQIVERQPHRLFPITVGQSLAYVNKYQNDLIVKVFNAQCEILKDLAEKSNCVFVGRCADYILKDYKPLKIFIYSDLKSKIERCKERNNDNLTEDDIRKAIKRIDKERAKYYEFYTGHKWGDKENYDFCINTSNTDIKLLVSVIAKIFK